MKKEIVKSSKVYDPAPAPWSQAIKIGNLLFISGTVGEDIDHKIERDFELQTRKIFENIEAMLQSAGASLKDVVKITGFLTRVQDYPTYNKVRHDVFKGSFPASTTVVVKELVRKEYLLEVEAVAIVP